MDRNPNHMAATRNRIGHFGRAISGRNEPERRETAQNAPKPPESGPPPCPVWEMNSDPSNPTYVRSCAHAGRSPGKTIAASVRTGADAAMQHRSGNPIKDQTKGLPADATPVQSRLISPPRDHRKGFSWVPTSRSIRGSARASALPKASAAVVEVPSPCPLMPAVIPHGPGACRSSGRIRPHPARRVVRPPAPAPARMQRLVVFLVRSLRMRTPRPTIGGRLSQWRLTKRSSGFGH
jgi:hypothetical protein